MTASIPSICLAVPIYVLESKPDTVLLNAVTDTRENSSDRASGIALNDEGVSGCLTRTVSGELLHCVKTDHDTIQNKARFSYIDNTLDAGIRPSSQEEKPNKDDHNVECKHHVSIK